MQNISVTITVDGEVYLDEDTNIYNLDHSECPLFGAEYNEYTDSAKLETCLESLRDAVDEQLKKIKSRIEGGK